MCREPETMTQGDVHPPNERRKPGTEPGTAVPGHGGGWGGRGGDGKVQLGVGCREGNAVKSTERD